MIPANMGGGAMVNVGVNVHGNAINYMEALQRELGATINRFREMASVVIVAQGFQAVGRQIQGMGRAITRNVIGPAVAGFADFEQQIKAVKFVTRATGEEFQALKRTAIDIGRTTPYGPVQASKALYALASAGFSAAQSQQALSASVNAANLSFGEMEADQAAETMAVILRKYNLEATTAAHVTDVLASSTIKSLLRMEDFRGFFDSLRATMGLTLEETLAVAEALSNMGMSGREAGENIYAFMRRFGVLQTIRERAQLSHRREARMTVQAMERLGVQAFDSAGQMRPLANIVRDILRNARQMTDLRRTTDLVRAFGASGLNVINALSQSTENFGARVEELRVGVVGLGAEGARQMMDSFHGIQKSWAAAQETLGIAFGESFAKPFRVAISAMTSVTRGFISLTDAVPPIKALTAAITTLAAALLGLAGTFAVVAGGLIAFMAPIPLIVLIAQQYKKIFGGVGQLAVLGGLKGMAKTFPPGAILGGRFRSAASAQSLFLGKQARFENFATFGSQATRFTEGPNAPRPGLTMGETMAQWQAERAGMVRKAYRSQDEFAQLTRRGLLTEAEVNAIIAKSGREARIAQIGALRARITAGRGLSRNLGSYAAMLTGRAGASAAGVALKYIAPLAIAAQTFWALMDPKTRGQQYVNQWADMFTSIGRVGAGVVKTVFRGAFGAVLGTGKLIFNMPRLAVEIVKGLPQFLKAFRGLGKDVLGDTVGGGLDKIPVIGSMLQFLTGVGATGATWWGISKTPTAAKWLVDILKNLPEQIAGVWKMGLKASFGQVSTAVSVWITKMWLANLGGFSLAMLFRKTGLLRLFWQLRIALSGLLLSLAGPLSFLITLLGKGGPIGALLAIIVGAGVSIARSINEHRKGGRPQHMMLRPGTSLPAAGRPDLVPTDYVMALQSREMARLRRGEAAKSPAELAMRELMSFSGAYGDMARRHNQVNMNAHDTRMQGELIRYRLARQMRGLATIMPLISTLSDTNFQTWVSKMGGPNRFRSMLTQVPEEMRTEAYNRYLKEILQRLDAIGTNTREIAESTYNWPQLYQMTMDAFNRPGALQPPLVSPSAGAERSPGISDEFMARHRGQSAGEPVILQPVSMEIDGRVLGEILIDIGRRGMRHFREAAGVR